MKRHKGLALSIALAASLVAITAASSIAASAPTKGAKPKSAPAASTKPAPGGLTADTAADTAALTKGLRWFGQSAFLIQDGKNIYIDPFELGTGLPPADLILITHDHYDHFSPEDIKKILKPSTTIVSVGLLQDKVPKGAAFKAVKPGDTLTVQGVRIEVVPAYNLGKPFHPKERGLVGFIVHSGGRSFYHAGDTDLIPEMKTIKADVALLPIGGKYTMDAGEAADAANLIKPKLAIPMHWGKIVGNAADAETFKAKTKVPVIILPAESAQPEGQPKVK
jgi:L-ascorbate metabolism protein UlaG (beta-lactamase superfamily)